jgi:hypothetical protein
MSNNKEAGKSYNSSPVFTSKVLQPAAAATKISNGSNVHHLLKIHLYRH